MRISDWSSDVCSSDLFADRAHLSASGQQGPHELHLGAERHIGFAGLEHRLHGKAQHRIEKRHHPAAMDDAHRVEMVDSGRSEEHTSELQSLMRISYAVFCLKKKHNPLRHTSTTQTTLTTTPTHKSTTLIKHT